MMRFFYCLLLAICFENQTLFSNEEPTCWPGFTPGEFRNEQVRESRFAEDARAIVIASAKSEFDATRPTLLVIYATPNGNTAEQTLGCQLGKGMDWHFDIQHAAAQWRRFRSLEKNRNSVLACVQANTLSWPAWKAPRPTGPAVVKQIVEALADSLPGSDVKVVLSSLLKKSISLDC